MNMMKNMIAPLLVASCLGPASNDEVAPPREAPVLVSLAEVPACPAVDPPPCVVEVVSAADPARVGYRLCCPQPGVALALLAVDSVTSIWGDVTKWAICGRGYVDEFTDLDRGASVPWAVLSTSDGTGGPISECRSSNAP